MVTETIKLNVKDWKIATQERSRDRMKLQIKLSKEDAEAFKNFTSVTKPEEVSLEDFVKAMFLTGIETYNAKLAAKAREYIEANKEKFAEAGVTPETQRPSLLHPLDSPPQLLLLSHQQLHLPPQVTSK